MSEIAKPITLYEVLACDDSLPIDGEALRCWLADLSNPLRWAVLPLLRVCCSVNLHLTYFLKRLIPIQFRAHRFLQWMICFFMKYFVTPEANVLIIRHFGVESNLLNFITANSQGEVEAVDLYPKMIRDLMEHSFVAHDQALFRTWLALGSMKGENWPIEESQLDFSTWKPLGIEYDTNHKKWTQFIDFETAHELFKSVFCLFLTATEYESAINSFQLDQSIAIRISRILGDPEILEMAHNRFPLFLVDPSNLTYRFALHGLFCEHLHETLEQIQRRAATSA